MKRVRIALGIISLIITIACIVLVAIEWNKIGCSVWGLIAESVMYSVCAFVVWYTIDDFLAGIQHREEDDEIYRKENK